MQHHIFKCDPSPVHFLVCPHGVQKRIKYVQKQMRHSSAQITLDRYAHILPDERQEATQRLDDTIFGEKRVPRVG